MRIKKSENIVDFVVLELSEIRKQKSVSHETVAKLAGLHRSTISLIESRKREPTLLTLLKICQALEVDLGGVITRAEKQSKK